MELDGNVRKWLKEKSHYYERIRKYEKNVVEIGFVHLDYLSYDLLVKKD